MSDTSFEPNYRWKMAPSKRRKISLSPLNMYLQNDEPQRKVQKTIEKSFSSSNSDVFIRSEATEKTTSSPIDAESKNELDVCKKVKVLYYTLFA